MIARSTALAYWFQKTTTAAITAMKGIATETELATLSDGGHPRRLRRLVGKEGPRSGSAGTELDSIAALYL